MLFLFQNVLICRMHDVCILHEITFRYATGLASRKQNKNSKNLFLAVVVVVENVGLGITALFCVKSSNAFLIFSLNICILLLSFVDNDEGNV